MVRVIDTFVCEDEPMMVMEWLTINLDKVVMGKKKFAIKEVFQEILKGVEEFHENEIVHRDLKSSSIMLVSKKSRLISQPNPADIDTYNYHVKIIYYGMAKELDFMGREMTNMVGTLFTERLNCCLGRSIMGKQWMCGLWGCIFHYFVTGMTLFKGENQVNQLQKIIEIMACRRAA